MKRIRSKLQDTQSEKICFKPTLDATIQKNDTPATNNLFKVPEKNISEINNPFMSQSTLSTPTSFLFNNTKKNINVQAQITPETLTNHTQTGFSFDSPTIRQRNDRQRKDYTGLYISVLEENNRMLRQIHNCHRRANLQNREVAALQKKILELQQENETLKMTIEDRESETDQVRDLLSEANQSLRAKDFQLSEWQNWYKVHEEPYENTTSTTPVTSGPSNDTSTSTTTATTDTYTTIATAIDTITLNDTQNNTNGIFNISEPYEFINEPNYINEVEQLPRNLTYKEEEVEKNLENISTSLAEEILEEISEEHARENSENVVTDNNENTYTYWGKNLKWIE